MKGKAMKLTNEIKYAIKHNGIDKITNKERARRYCLATNGVVFNNTNYLLTKINEIERNNYRVNNDWVISGRELLPMSERFNVNEYKRMKRCKERVNQLINEGQCLFLTFTFSNDYYKDTNQDTRRRYVYRTLKSLDVPFIANQDFGKTNGRHHIHALILCDSVNHNVWKYGNLDFERVWSNPEKVGEYVGKLTEHTLKETTKNNRVMYSRNYQWVN